MTLGIMGGWCSEMMGGEEIMRRRTSDLVWIGVEPCTPPAKRTSCDDLMLAQCHQLHVAPTVFAFVPIHKLNVVMSGVEAQHAEMVLCPFHTSWITEDEEMRVCDRLPEITHCTLEIPTIVAVEIETEHVAPTGMDGHRLAMAQFFGKFNILC